jgi:diguanylate cyclase
VSKQAAVQRTSEQIEAAVGEVLTFLSEANDGAATYGQSLESNLGEMAAADNMDGLRKAIETLVFDTKKMATQNELLHNRLENSTREIQALQENLEDVRAESLTDGLTNIPNRKAFDMNLRQEAMNAMESGEDLCLLICDIDHFKKFNDNYGHQTGDQVLKLAGMILTQNVKGRDTAARYGGEEFAIILPNTPLDAACNLANKVREAVASKRIRKKSTGEDFGAITMSIGVAKFRGGESLSELIQRADKGLYQAKDNGRNCVVKETELPDE